ncbi:MAG: DUF4438 domain-containing protein [Candidatus Bathyarchaeia archaeon]
MVKTNKERLLEVALIGEITHPSVEGTYLTGWDGAPRIGVGRGGIVYNVKIGDSCFGWAWGEKVEPGVSADGIGKDREKGSFRNLSCVGNKVKVIKGEAKGEEGIVVGKIGYLPDGTHHVVINFPEDIVEKLAIGDKVQVKAKGVGIELEDYPEVRAVSTSPELLDSMNIEESDGKLQVPVTKVIPPEFIGQGSGGSPVESRNWDVQTQSPDAIEELKDLRLGDIVLLKDILSEWGRGYFEGAVTLGVVSCGASVAMGQGIGVTVLMTCKDGQIEPVIDSEANLSNYLNIGGA